MKGRWPDDDVILYDSVCVFCSRWIRFVATRDIAHADFTAIRSSYGTHGWQMRSALTPVIDTNAVIHGGVAVYLKSDGALTMQAYCCGWGWTRALLPYLNRCAQLAVYNLVTSRNRYRIFGKYDQCFVPDAAMRARVMGGDADYPIPAATLG